MKAILIFCLAIIALALWMIAFYMFVDSDREPVVQHLEDGITYITKDGVTESIDGNFVFRCYKNEPIHFHETYEHSEAGVLESWGTSTPYNDNLFGGYSLSLDDKDANGDMDQISLTLDSRQDGWPVIMTTYNDLDGDRYPDRFSYTVMEKGRRPTASLDLDLDGTFDYRHSESGYFFRLESGWQPFEGASIELDSSVPIILDSDGSILYSFKDGNWTK